MVARRRWRVRLAAIGAGVAINAGLLALLTLERLAPPMAEPAVVVVALDSHECQPKRPAEPMRRSRASASPLKPSASPPPAMETFAPPTVQAQASPSQPVDRRWWVGNGEYLDPVTARRARQAWEAAEKRRFQRACLGQSSEPMTSEEKTACWEAWSAAPRSAY